MQLEFETITIQPLISGENCRTILPVRVIAVDSVVTYILTSSDLPSSITFNSDGSFSGSFLTDVYREFLVTIKAYAPSLLPIQQQFSFKVLPAIYNKWFNWAGFYTNFYSSVTTNIVDYFKNDNVVLYTYTPWYEWNGVHIDVDIPFDNVNIPGKNSWFDYSISVSESYLPSFRTYFLYYGIDDMTPPITSWWLYDTNDDTDIVDLHGDLFDRDVIIYSEIDNQWWPYFVPQPPEWVTGQIKNPLEFSDYSAQIFCNFASTFVQTDGVDVTKLGLTINEFTGYWELVGTPNIYGNFGLITLSATNVFGTTYDLIQLTIDPAPPEWLTATLDHLIQDQFYDTQIQVNYGFGFSQIGGVDLNGIGLTLDTSNIGYCELIGTPTMYGIYNIVLQATNGPAFTNKIYSKWRQNN